MSKISTNFTFNASHIFSKVPIVRLVLPASILLILDFSKLQAAAKSCWLIFFSSRIFLIFTPIRVKATSFFTKK